MEGYQDVIKEDLPFIFQLLESENEVITSIVALEDDMTQINNIKKQLNLEFHNQSHLIRNLIFSGIFSTIIVLFFHLSPLGSFLLSLASLMGYDFYKKDQIKKYMSDKETQFERIYTKKINVQNQLGALVEKNAIYTNKIPEQFRDPNSVATLFNYLYCGQADNLKEAYHLLDLEYRHQEHMGILREHSNLLEENNQIAYQQLNQLQGLTSLQEQQLTAIRELSLTARNINSTLVQTDKRAEGLEERFVPKYKRKS